jgi:molybdopterin converting factor subunit 1
MKVRVKLFAVAKELAGSDAISVELPAAATIDDVRRAVAAAHPNLDRILSHAMWAVNAKYADDTTIVNKHSDIALIPPVSGG